MSSPSAASRPLPLLLALLALGPGVRAELSRGPYIVDASSTSAEICWRQAGQDACRTFAGLTPRTTFSYEIPGSTRTWTAAALPSPSQPLSFAVLGDSGDGKADQRRVARVLEQSEAQLVLHVGDIIYPGGKDKDYDKKFFRPYEKMLARAPFFPTLGNHDYGNHKSAEKAQKTYQDVYRRVHRRPKYYSFDAGPAHFISLDTNAAYKITAAAPFGPESEQTRWLEEDLARSKASWKFAFLHVPLYTTALYHGDNAALRESWEPLFRKYGVDVVFQGHDHFYERSRPLGGVVYVTAGTGGASLSRMVPEEQADWLENKIVDFGLVSVRVDAERLLLSFQDKDGEVKDLLRLEKSPPPESVSFRSGDGWILSGTYQPPRPGRPVALLVHGAASSKGEWERFSSELWTLGLGTLALDLRGHGASTQGPAGKAGFDSLDASGSWPGAVKDIEAALAFLGRGGVPPENVGLIGASIGANLVTAAAAAEPRAPWVILLSPGGNYRGVGLTPLPGRKLLAAASPADPYAYAAARALAASRGAPVFLEARRGHGVQMFDDPEFLGKLLDWLKAASAGG